MRVARHTADGGWTGTGGLAGWGPAGLLPSPARCRAAGAECISQLWRRLSPTVEHLPCPVLLVIRVSCIMHACAHQIWFMCFLCHNMTVKDNTTLYACMVLLLVIRAKQSYRSEGLLPLSMWWMELLLHCTGHNPWNWLDIHTRNYLEVRGKTALFASLKSTVRFAEKYCSLRWKVLFASLKSTVRWFIMREKYCSFAEKVRLITQHD